LAGAAALIAWDYGTIKTVDITVSYPTTDAGRAITVEALDGGRVVAPAKNLTVAQTARSISNFEPVTSRAFIKSRCAMEFRNWSSVLGAGRRAPR